MGVWLVGSAVVCRSARFEMPPPSFFSRPTDVRRDGALRLKGRR